MSRRTKVAVWLGSVALVVGLCIALAPVFIAMRVNKQLADMGDGYVGSVEGAELRLLRGELGLRGLRIEKADRSVPTPFMTMTELTLALVDGPSWYQPHVAFRFEQPVMSYVDAPTKAAQQWGPKFDLKELREQLKPLELDEVALRDAQIHLRNFHARPAMDSYVQHANVIAAGLAGCLPEADKRCAAQIHGQGVVMSSGKLVLDAKLALTDAWRFDVDGALRGLRAAQLSPLLIHYTKIDAQAGRVDLELRYRLRGTHFQGLLIPRLEELDILGSDQAGTGWFRELGAAAVAGYFERRSGKKAVAFNGSGGLAQADFELVDLPARKSARTDREP